MISKKFNEAFPPHTLNVLHLPRLCIFDSLLLEESLFRLAPKYSQGTGFVILNHPPGRNSYEYNKIHPYFNSSGILNREKYSNIYDSPSVVFGLSGIPEEHVNIEAIKEDNVPLIRRFTGGGTVLIDDSCVISSIILPKKFVSSPPFPVPVMSWIASNFYSPSYYPIHPIICAKDVSESKIHGNLSDTWDYRFSFNDASNNFLSENEPNIPINFKNLDKQEAGLVRESSCEKVIDNTGYLPSKKNNFNLRLLENDYVIDLSGTNDSENPVCPGNDVKDSWTCFRKVGGNALSISRDYVIQQTSFLWKVNNDLISKYLKIPKIKPAYRRDRGHGEFLCGIHDVYKSSMPSENHLIDLITQKAKFIAMKEGWKFNLVKSQSTKFESTCREDFMSDYKDFLDCMVCTYVNSVKNMRKTFFIDYCGNNCPD